MLLPMLELFFPADQNTCGMLNKTKCGRACAAAGTIHWSVGENTTTTQNTSPVVVGLDQNKC